jgi:AraC family transcriptional regulator
MATAKKSHGMEASDRCSEERREAGMSEGGLYGRRLGQHFGLGNPPAFVTRALKTVELAVTQLKCDMFGHGMTNPLPREDAYVVELQIWRSDREFWVDGRALGKRTLADGVATFSDLRRNPACYMLSPFHSLAFYLPRRAFDEIADDTGAQHIEDLTCEPGAGVDDPILRNLGLALLGAFERPEEVSPILIDHIALGFCAHIAHTYGGMRAKTALARGGLAPWQERRAKEILSANLAVNVGLKALARECGLSVSHFSRAFRNSTGAAPHRWLLEYRVDAAKPLLRDRELPLSDVALACGFADQSHFTRTFTRVVGVSPGAWRRCLEA